MKPFISLNFIKAQHFKHQGKRLYKERNSIYYAYLHLNEMSRLQYNLSIGRTTIWHKYGVIIGKLRMFIFRRRYGNGKALLHFLGPANSHTHILSMHCCDTRLRCLVCFSKADFSDHVKPRLRQWDPWRALDGRYGSDIHPCVSETSHRPSRLVKAYD